MGGEQKIEKSLPHFFSIPAVVFVYSSRDSGLRPGSSSGCWGLFMHRNPLARDFLTSPPSFTSLPSFIYPSSPACVFYVWRNIGILINKMGAHETYRIYLFYQKKIRVEGTDFMEKVFVEISRERGCPKECL